jgi:hypothetical protein
MSNKLSDSKALRRAELAFLSNQERSEAGVCASDFFAKSKE